MYGHIPFARVVPTYTAQWRPPSAPARACRQGNTRAPRRDFPEVAERSRLPARCLVGYLWNENIMN